MKVIIIAVESRRGVIGKYSHDKPHRLFESSAGGGVMFLDF